MDTKRWTVAGFGIGGVALALLTVLATLAYGDDSFQGPRFSVLVAVNLIAVLIAVSFVTVAVTVRAIERRGARPELEGRVRQLEVDNAFMSAALRELLPAVTQIDEQVEINGVRLTKLIKMIDDQRIAEAPTVPIGGLHSINGGKLG